MVDSSNAQLVMVLEDEVSMAFPMIVDGLREVIRRDASPDWNEYDVYHELKLKSAQLFIGYADGEYQGFMVMTEGHDQMFIWIIYTTPNKLDMFDDHMETVCNYARGEDKKYLKFGTTRKGWLKVAPKYGFELDEYRFRRTL